MKFRPMKAFSMLPTSVSSSMETKDGGPARGEEGSKPCMTEGRRREAGGFAHSQSTGQRVNDGVPGSHHNHEEE